MSNVKTIKTRDFIEDKYKWKIEKLYESVSKWEEDFEKLKKETPILKTFSSQLNNPEKLMEFFKKYVDMSRALDKIYVYAQLKGDEDTSNTVYQGLRSKIDTFMAEFRSYYAYLEPEILSLPEDYLEKAIEKVPELKEYRFFLDKILNQKPHTLSKEKEELLASVSSCLYAAEDIYSMLTNADMTFPVIKDEEGNEVELTEVNYGTFIRSKDRRVREDAFKALFSTYKKYINTIATSLTFNIKNLVLETKIRNYDSCLETALKPNNIPLDVYNSSLETVNKHLSLLHRYVDIKKRLLGLSDIHMYDLYVPVIDVEKEHIEYEDAVNIVKEGLHPLGEEYLSIFSEGIKEGWVDVFENKGKRGGAYSWGCYDSMPYVLLNYNYGLDDVSTLAHEMGHSIHSYYSREEQPYIYSEYTIFCAEVASTCNEALLINYLINKEKDRNKRLYLINQELEQIRTTVFRQLMFAEFEAITHSTMEKGSSLTGEDLNKIWHDLNVKYFGPSMIIDEEIDIEWARIPHFYGDFYVYQYATGYAAASSFANSILKEGEKAVERYKGFLKAGGSDYPINILKKAGVDMTTSKPLEATMMRFKELLDMLEEEI
ncbi:oligoendopeptidase F [Clostridium sp.]|uniref:oligoendopeptidase F n=1 Tax=Clostridium sp. TaxID=1506 RepID=UPI0034638F8D